MPVQAQVRWQPCVVWRKECQPATRAKMHAVFTGNIRLQYRRRSSIDTMGVAHLTTETSVVCPINFVLELEDELDFELLDKTYRVSELTVRGAIVMESGRGERTAELVEPQS